MKYLTLWTTRDFTVCLRNLAVLLIMTTEQKAAVIVAWNGLNYATWRVQC